MFLPPASFSARSGKFLSTAERISPKLVDLYQRRKEFNAQMTDWPKPVDSPNNLYDEG